MTKIPTTRNSLALASFTAYCRLNPDMRFWQALRNWCGWPFVLVSDGGERTVDTFYWEGLENIREFRVVCPFCKQDITEEEPDSTFDHMTGKCKKENPKEGANQ